MFPSAGQEVSPSAGQEVWPTAGQDTLQTTGQNMLPSAGQYRSGEIDAVRYYHFLYYIFKVSKT